VGDDQQSIANFQGLEYNDRDDHRSRCPDDTCKAERQIFTHPVEESTSYVLDRMLRRIYEDQSDRRGEDSERGRKWDRVG